MAHTGVGNRDEPLVAKVANRSYVAQRLASVNPRTVH
jgi:hypothetical protein